MAIDDETARVAALAVQGPTSFAVLQRSGFSGIETLKPFRAGEVAYRDAQVLVSRTGFTGDLGYELWLDPRHADALWDDLMANNDAYQVKPFGSKALDLLRLEAGFLQPHVDFVPAAQALRTNRGRSPFELGYGRLVDFDKGHFIGRRALLAERRDGSRYQLVRLDIGGNKPAHESLLYHARKTQVGHVTSAMWSPTCKRNIAIAMLEAGRADLWEQLWADIYVRKELKWHRVMERCRVVEGPFFRPGPAHRHTTRRLLIRRLRREPQRPCTRGSLRRELTFALRDESIDLLIPERAFEAAPKAVLEAYVRATSTGTHTPRAWFFYETLTRQTLAVDDAPQRQGRRRTGSKGVYHG